MENCSRSNALINSRRCSTDSATSGGRTIDHDGSPQKCAIAPLSGLSKGLSQAGVTAYWGVRALDSLLSEGDLELVGLNRPDFPAQLVVPGLHAAALLLLTLVVLRKPGRRAS